MDIFVFILLKTKQPVHVIVFEVVTCNSDFIALFIFSLGIRLNMEVYIKCLADVDLTGMERVAAGGPYVWVVSLKGQK